MPTTRFFVVGGVNYTLDFAPESGFDTLEDAVDEWNRRRNNQLEFPCWGDGLEDDDCVVVGGDEENVDDGWTARNLPENAALTNLRALAKEILAADDEGRTFDLDVMAELLANVVENFDNWLSSAGFLPAEAE